MKISTLDKMLPNRWNLLFRYYLPFFKKPDAFYFKSREFINELKKNGIRQNFPLEKLPELLVILENYSKNNSRLIDFSIKIIDTLEKKQLQAIDFNLLKRTLSKYGMDNNNQTPVLNALFNRLPNPVYTRKDQKANFRTIEKIKEFDIDAKLSYLKTKGKITDIKVFLENVPNNQWSILIDKLIDFFYNSLKIEGTFLTKEIKEEDFYFQFLNCILDNYKISNERYPLNIMQFFAISSLLNVSIDIEEINKIPSQSKFIGNFSIELQEFLAENRIKALKNLIKIDFIDKVQKIPTRDGGIHRKFHIFYTDKYLNLSPNPVAELDLIIKELPISISTLNYDKLKSIQKIFKFTYQLLDLPLIKEIKIKRVIAAEKARVNYERLSEARRELTKRIGMGMQFRVSHQRMSELFGEQALKMKNKWGKLGITFFDADNPIERQSAIQEAASLKAAWNSMN